MLIVDRDKSHVKHFFCNFSVLSAKEPLAKGIR